MGHLIATAYLAALITYIANAIYQGYLLYRFMKKFNGVVDAVEVSVAAPA